MITEQQKQKKKYWNDVAAGHIKPSVSKTDKSTDKKTDKSSKRKHISKKEDKK